MSEHRLIRIFLLLFLVGKIAVSSDNNIASRPEFRRFLHDFGLQKWYDDKRVFTVPWHENLRYLRYFSTTDFVVIGHFDADFFKKKDGVSSLESSCDFRVVSLLPDSFGQVLASCLCLYGFNSAEVLEFYYDRPNSFTNIGPTPYFKKRKPFKGIGEWAIVMRDDSGDGENAASECQVSFCRNGVVIISSGHDGCNFRFLPFLHDVDVTLQRDPTQPTLAPVGFSETEYQKNVEKYKAWEKEEERKSMERRERELAKLRAEAARPRPPARPQQPFFVWTDEIAAPGKALMRKWFPDSPEELGTWRGGYAAAPGNPLSQRVTAESLRGRFPIVSPLSPRYGRGDAFHVCLSSRDGKERCAVAVLHARSAPEAREALAWLCLTGGDCGGLRKIGGEPVRFKKRPSLAIGDFCVSNQGDVREDGTVAPGSDEREIYFLRGDTAAMVRALPPAPSVGAGAAPGGSAVATAKRLDGIIKEALAAGQ